MSATLYAGPAKLYYNSIGLFVEGENGEVKIGADVEALDIASATAGFIDANQGDVRVPIDFKPFDNWSSLATLFPAAVTTPAIGTRFGGAGADVATKVWTPDGRLYTVPSTFMLKHPELHLGVGVGLFGPAQLMGLLASASSVGTAAAFYTITESAASDPGGNFTMADFIRERWLGAWGTVAGFGGDGGTVMEAEDEWTITPEVKYSPLKVQKLTRAYKLDSVKFMFKARLYGPTQTQINNALKIQSSGGALGRRLGAAGLDMVLTGAVSGKTITGKNMAIVGAGYEFGGTKLGTGEVGFVCGQTFTTGAANPLIVFSA